MPQPIEVRWGPSWHPATLLDTCPGQPGWVWVGADVFRGRKLFTETEWRYA